MKAVKCSPSTFAKTMKTSAKEQFEIHIFSPFSRKLPSDLRVARARAPSASEPDPDSDSAVGADELAADEPRQVLLLLRVVAEQQQRHDREAGHARRR